MTHTFAHIIAILSYNNPMNTNIRERHEVIIVWAGAAGIWVALKLKELGVDYLVLEWDEVASSFNKWSNETHFISPSFPSNAFGQVDLNAIHPETSPGYMFGKEHVSGQEYAKYVKSVVQAFDVLVYENEKVQRVEKQEDIFVVYTDKQAYACIYVISAIWEFQFPSSSDIRGSENAIHSSTIRDFTDYKTIRDVLPIIGWYESAVDTAYALCKHWKQVHIFCSHNMDEMSTSDPSQVLSLYSLQRLREMQENPRVIFTQDPIIEITKKEREYIIIWKSWKKYVFFEMPILATGFRPPYDFLWEYISFRDHDHMPELNEVDELKKTKNIFVVGAQVRQGELIFCFVYKYRLRFWVVALEIAKRLGKEKDFESYKRLWEKQWFYLDDLWACWDECMC